ncbi:sulfotransferase [Mycolicibacterium diernhoferi]|uniref:Sulfotransferase family protein n=4 Tax=Mycolicibacterium TaxID=1866885 RepID=A0A1Q4HAY3_9MYCO|nr:sulfotransferase family protein [Mycolicibacterium diernhoferi]OPE56059.1 sulfotransferase family protein [Mycolicibacterium diernhoferi]
MTETTADVIHLDDLATPRYSAEAQAIREMMATVAADFPLDADVLHERARADTGLDDFGADDYRERLELYVAGLREIDMHGPGIVNFGSQLVQWLKNRLLLTDLLKRHPEIHDIELLAPVVIAGLPRSGTTHLHNLLAAAPTFRSLPYWESVEPFPLPIEVGLQPDPRITRMDVAVQVMNILMPHFALMHEMTTEHAHEEIQLLANDFSTMLMDTLADVPRWSDFYWSRDQTPSYEYLAIQLKALQFLRGGRRWVLKSPQHLGQLPVLDKVFPGVVVAFTHRDPVPVALSMIAMIAYSERMHRDTVDVSRIANRWVDRLGQLLEGCVRDRHVIGPERSVDIRFEDFLTDEVGTAERLYALAGEPFDDAARGAITDYLAAHRRGRLGRVATSPEMFGLDPDAVRARFGGYSERFLR